MPETRKKYDREFREGAVQIVNETGSRSLTSPVTWGSTRARWELRAVARLDPETARSLTRSCGC